MTKVFLVHGRNSAAKKGFTEFLEDLGLEVFDWDSVVALVGSPNPYVWEIVEAGIKAADLTIVLFTPDDAAVLLPELDGDGIVRAQARPNVYLEAGYAMARKPEPLLVEMGDHTLATDLAGMHMLRLDGRVSSQKSFLSRLTQLSGHTFGYVPKVDDIRLIPKIPALGVEHERLFPEEGVIQAVAPELRENATRLYRVLPDGGTDLRIHAYGEQDSGFLITTSVFRGSFLRVTRGVRHTKPIAPIGFAYELHGEIVENMLELTNEDH